VVPYRLGFNVAHEGFGFDDAIDIFLLLDLVLNFFTAYKRKAYLVTDNRSIALYYLRTWFVVDLIASLPLDQFFSFNRLLRMVRLAKLFRLARLVRYSASLRAATNLQPPVVRLVQYLFSLVWFWHVVASLYW
jgi:hypothetical protein